ncbi:MAG TPA: arsenite methyltransferase [Bacteroidales bacterium]|nr:arsenite methyltransferase [Bacteroidales bacterium]
MKPKDIKQIVQEKYGQIASSSDDHSNKSCGCSPDCGSSAGYTIFSESYNHLEGYHPDADLSLGCGIPTKFAAIAPGDRVLDLGSGAGNDCFVARAIVGETGHVTGLDFTEAMLHKAEENRRKLGFSNVEFVKGDIEEMPLPDNRFDVILSNCVLNLVPDKQKAFGEIMRVLKPGGHFCVSDVVLRGELPEKIRSDAEMYAGCVSGAMEKDDYLRIIEKQGFKDIKVHKEKQILLPDNLLKGFTDDSEMSAFNNGENGIFSITVTGYKN